jgi:hypothetical protein
MHNITAKVHKIRVLSKEKPTLKRQFLRSTNIKAQCRIWSSLDLPPAFTIVSCTAYSTCRWRRYVSPKSCLTFNWLHGVIFHKIVLFIKTQLSYVIYPRRSCSFLTSASGMRVQMGEMSHLGRLIGWATRDMWADSLYFLSVMFGSICKTFASFQHMSWPSSNACWANSNFSIFRADPLSCYICAL